MLILIARGKSGGDTRNWWEDRLFRVSVFPGTINFRSSSVLQFPRSPFFKWDQMKYREKVQNEKLIAQLFVTPTNSGWKTRSIFRKIYTSKGVSVGKFRVAVVCRENSEFGAVRVRKRELKGVFLGDLRTVAGSSRIKARNIHDKFYFEGVAPRENSLLKFNTISLAPCRIFRSYQQLREILQRKY